MLKKDNILLGLIVGFLSPILGFFVYYLIKFRLFTFQEFLHVLKVQSSFLTAIISLSLIANAVVFTIYINRQKDKTARGIFIATCVYALIALGIKWWL